MVYDLDDLLTIMFHDFPCWKMDISAEFRKQP
ncbi:hypothetical protein XF_0084 [Xylella fastidiosa 9a5c]|uniref:Uncharacterized protein n=1 Tax=Xylella fastidiosa (strain 9a5c) TaxID=160492 RepID=Q9PH62_XYLFA|nr:hypothetical protein XF_0084 [Xylella fastidiosa 9a5c]